MGVAVSSVDVVGSMVTLPACVKYVRGLDIVPTVCIEPFLEWPPNVR